MTQRKRIVYIEDKVEMISLTRIFLRQKGFDVVGASSGAEGLETIKQEKPDLVLLDVVMPGMTGWEVYQQMQARDDLAQIPVIFVSASARQLESELKAAQNSQQLVEYIAKPFAPRVLLDSIRRIISKVH